MDADIFYLLKEYKCLLSTRKLTINNFETVPLCHPTEYTTFFYGYILVWWYLNSHTFRMGRKCVACILWFLMLKSIPSSLEVTESEIEQYVFDYSISQLYTIIVRKCLSILLNCFSLKRQRNYQKIVFKFNLHLCS